MKYPFTHEEKPNHSLAHWYIFFSSDSNKSHSANFGGVKRFLRLAFFLRNAIKKWGQCNKCEELPSIRIQTHCGNLKGTITLSHSLRDINRKGINIALYPQRLR